LPVQLTFIKLMRMYLVSRFWYENFGGTEDGIYLIKRTSCFTVQSCLLS